MRKPAIWLGDALEVTRAFPALARSRLGHQIARLQEGLDPLDWKPMASVGLGVRELRIRAGGAYRVIYVVKFVEAVYVVHVFEKKTRRTAQTDIELARTRFRALVSERKRP